MVFVIGKASYLIMEGRTFKQRLDTFDIRVRRFGLSTRLKFVVDWNKFSNAVLQKRPCVRTSTGDLGASAFISERVAVRRAHYSHMKS